MKSETGLFLKAPLLTNKDPEISCLMCNGDGTYNKARTCDYLIEIRGNGRVLWVGLHKACARDPHFEEEQ